MGEVLAVVLAGGRGKRMDVLCHVRPKPALPFAGGFQVIDFTLSNCVYSGIRNLAILTDYQRSHMATYLKRWSLANSTGQFDILEPRAGSYRGTADAVYQNLAHLGRSSADNVLILAGDHIYKMDYSKMLAFHLEVKADVTVGVVRVPLEDASRFGTISAAPGGRILDFLEKSMTPLSNLASMGIYIFSREILNRRLTEDAARSDSPHDFGYAILPGMVANKDRAFAYEFSGYWQDIGTPQAYYAANMELVSRNPAFSLDGTRRVLTQKQDLPPPIVFEGATVTNSLLSPGCVVKGRVNESVLSPGVIVEESAVVRNSVLMRNVFVGYHSVVDRCVLDEGVSVGKFCYLGFGDALLPSDGDITVLGKGTTVPSHTAVGRNCKVMPGVQPSDFQTNMVPSGSLLAPRLKTAAVPDKDRVPSK